MDLLISGKSTPVNRARAAMASRLTTAAAHLTIAEEAQAVEDRLAQLARPRDGTDEEPRFDAAAEETFAQIDRELASIEIPYEEWEILYRQRLQVERDLRRASIEAWDRERREAGQQPIGQAEGALAAVDQLVRTGAGAAADLATDVAGEVVADERTGKALGEVAGTGWRVVAGLAAVAASIVRSLDRAGEPRDQRERRR
jgi:hypothetical protein